MCLMGRDSSEPPAKGPTVMGKLNVYLQLRFTAVETVVPGEFSMGDSLPAWGGRAAQSKRTIFLNVWSWPFLVLCSKGYSEPHYWVLGYWGWYSCLWIVAGWISVGWGGLQSQRTLILPLCCHQLEYLYSSIWAKNILKIFRSSLKGNFLKIDIEEHSLLF